MHRKHIAVMYGTEPNIMIPSLLDRLNIRDNIPLGKPVGIKPNLVVSKPSNSGATTDPEIVESIILYLQSHNFHDIVVLESAWIGDDTDRAFEVCGYRDMADRLNVKLINVEKEQCIPRSFGDMTMHVSKRATSLGYLINVPVLKAHCQTLVTGALKNMKGLIPASEKRRFHDLGLDNPIAVLNKILKPDLTVVDGIIGDLSFEEGGNPVRMNRIFAGRDPVLIDAYAATLLGYAPTEIGHIRRAASLGVGSMDLPTAHIDEINAPNAASPDIAATHHAKKQLRFIDQRGACSACLGSLLHALHRIDAFQHSPLSAEKLHIGQGYKEISGPGIGIGSCTCGFARHVKGCPPSALDIRKFIESALNRVK